MFRVLPVFLIVLILSSYFFKGQNNQVDSLRNLLPKAATDTVTAERYLRLGLALRTQKPQEAKKVFEQGTAFAETTIGKNNLDVTSRQVMQLKLGRLYYLTGVIFSDEGKVEQALHFYNKSLEISTRLANKRSSAYTLNDIGAVYLYQGDPDKALEFYLKGLKLREEIQDKKGIGNSLNNIGLLFLGLGNNLKALENLNKALKIFEEIGDLSGENTVLACIAGVYHAQGDIQKTLFYFERSLKIAEKLGEKKAIARGMLNLAVVYKGQGEHKKTLEYYTKCLAIFEEIQYPTGIATTAVNMGNVYKSIGDTDKAMTYYDKGLDVGEKINSIYLIALSCQNKAAIYSDRHIYDKAFENFTRCIKIQREMGKKPDLAFALSCISRLYYHQDKLTEALKYGLQAHQLAMELGFPISIKNTAENLYAIYQSKGDFKRSLENYELAIKMQDSLNNESTRKASIRSQLKYEYEKQAAADSITHAKENEVKSAELGRQSAEIKAKKNQQYALLGGLILVMVFAGFMYNRFKITQKQKLVIEQQKEIVEDQKKLVEEKQKEVLDSIHYAKRIQLAQIPSEKRILSMIDKIRKN
jgi:tetratricopeptide (TPR) repeat protein